MRMEIHPSGAKSYALIICTEKGEKNDLYDFSPSYKPLEAIIEHCPNYKYPHIRITIPEVKP